MAEVSGMATSYDLPQYLGELFQKSRKPNTVLRLVGNLTGTVRLVPNTQFPMGVNYELNAASQPANLEGADPTPAEFDTAQVENVVQIFQESVKLSYSRQGARNAIDGVAIIPGGTAGDINRPGTIEWQIERKVEQIARDANYSFLRGTYALPANNATARGTRGIRTAITTNDTNAAAAALSKTIVETHLQGMVEAGSIEMGQEVAVLGGAAALANLIGLYEAATQVPEARDVAGVGIRRIVTKWATLDLFWEPDLAAAELLTFQPELCQVVAMPIPSSGILFSEMLAKTGAAEHWQVYGEFGIDYTDEFYHGVIRNFT